MRNYKVLVLTFLILMMGRLAFGQVIISQYYEGSSNNKWIELTNVGTESVDLSTYYLGRWSGTDEPTGSAANADVLTGTLEAGQTMLYKNADAVLPDYAEGTATTATYFNGDDPVALCNGSDTWEDRVDCIYASVADGKWGDDRSFYRKSNVTAGNLEMSDLSGMGEWIETTNDAVDNATADQTEYLGTHIFGVPASPIIAVNPSVLSFGELTVDSQLEQQFTVCGADLTADITITSPRYFDVSLTSGEDFVSGSPIVLTQTDGVVTETTIYVRFTPDDINDYSGDIELTSTDAATKIVAVSGSGIADNAISFTDFEDETFGEWTTVSIASENNWEISSYGGANGSGFAAQMNGYGEDEASNDWLISPEFNFDNYVNEVFSFYSSYKYGAAGQLTVKYSTDYAGDPATATWTELEFTEPESSETWEKAEFDFSMISGTGRIALQYLSPGDDTRRWTVDELKFAGDPYMSETALSTTDFEDGSLGSWTMVNVSGGNEWYVGEYSGNHYAKASGYNEDAPSDTWLISPSFNLDWYAAENMTFISGKGYFTAGADPEMTLLYSTDYNDDVSSATWTELDFDRPSDDDDYYTWAESGKIDLSMIEGTNVHFAFRYLTNDQQATWQIDDITIYGDASVAIPEIAVSAASVDYYQTPINTTTDSEFKVSAANLTEDLVLTLTGADYSISLTGGDAFAGQSTLTLSPVEGVVPETTIYVRFAPVAMDFSEGNITCTSGQAQAKSITLKGLGVAENVVLYNGFEFGNFGNWSTYSVASDKDWVVSDATGANESIYCAEMSGYQEDEASMDWLVSPKVNFDDYNAEILSFYTRWKYGGGYQGELNVCWSNDYVEGESPSNGYTWNYLTFEKPAENMTWLFSGDIDLSAIEGEAHIAFIYGSVGADYGGQVRWRVDDITLTGKDATGINELLPQDYELSQNYPNPFNPATSIKFGLKADGLVQMNIYNSNGQMVQTLVNKQMRAGRYSVKFNAEKFNSGVYFYQLKAGNKIMTKKMILVK